MTVRYCSNPSPFSRLLPYYKGFTKPKPSISPQSLMSTTSIFPLPSASLSVSLHKRSSLSLQTHCCSSSSSLMEFHESPSSIIFIKGLPLSTSEGHLRESFSQFGEVSRVKLVSDKKTKQSLGFAYVWFTREDSAQLAVEEMNGKFLDGRFIFVTIAKPGSCKTPRRVKPYKF